MRNSKLEAFIIKKINIFEKDKILTLLSPTEGKIQVKAKHVRNINSKRLAHLELLNLTSFSLYKRSSMMPVVTEAYSYKNYPNIKSNLIKINLSFHICEIVENLVSYGAENRNVFYLLKNTLEELENKAEDFYKIVHDFEIKLLFSLGFSSPNQNLKGARASLFIENIIEKKLKSREIIKKINFNSV